jgi:hypothetical protein
MGYSGLLMEFGEHPMHSWELFNSAKESKRQALADSIHFVFFWHIKEPELEEIQNEFLLALYQMSSENSELLPDAVNLKEAFIEFYQAEGKDLKECIHSTFGTTSPNKEAIMYHSFVKYLKVGDKY